VLVSQQALTTWLLQHHDGSIPTEPHAEGTAVDGQDNQLLPKHVSQDDILCEHKQLDPLKAKNLKRINKVGDVFIIYLDDEI
jgi:hypothetical protein